MAGMYNSKHYQKVSVIKGHCIFYKAVWMLTTGKELSVQVEDNNHDEHTVAVTKNSQIISPIHFVGKYHILINVF